MRAAIAAGLYALEIHLKVRICQRLNLANLPKSFEIHDLDGLVVLAGLRGRSMTCCQQRVKTNWEDIVDILSNNLNDLQISPGTRTGPSDSSDDFFRMAR